MRHPGPEQRWHPPRRCRGLGRPVALGAAAALLAGCGLIGGPATVRMDVPDVMTVTSPDLSDGAMGAAFTCHGAGKHPGIHWSGAPANTKSLALVMDDSAAPITPYIYWIVFNIRPQTTDIQGGTLPPGQPARQARNSKGSVGYYAPCPVNRGHSYRFTVYALGKVLSLKNGTSVETAWSSIAQAAIARGRLTTVADP
jgi:Raf kinase inhibitor-like YbhB/YbcL family protein